MEKYLVASLIISNGLFRLLDGSHIMYPRAVTNVLIAATAGSTAYLASSSLTVSAVVGIFSATTIQMGATDWSNIRHQLIRGFYPCALMLIVLILLDWQLAKLSILGMLGLHMLAFGIYYGVNRIKTPFIEYEQICRVAQGFLICLAAALV